jgi:hypothetical protein
LIFSPKLNSTSCRLYIYIYIYYIYIIIKKRMNQCRQNWNNN